MEINKFNNLCSHYQDTYVIHTLSIKKRDLLFYILLIILSFFVLQLKSSDFFTITVNQIISKSIGDKINISFYIVSSLLWFMLSILTIKYFQVLLEIERQYKYIKDLEICLQRIYNDNISFTREGVNYKNKNKLFNTWSIFIYRYVFLALLTIIPAMVIVYQFNPNSGFSVGNIVNIICFLITFSSTSIYIYTINKA
jgi:hypothetical protein